MGDFLKKVPIVYKPLRPLKEVTEEDKEQIRKMVKEKEGYDLPECWFESMDTVKWVSDTKILVGTYAPLSDREWEFDMVNNTYELVTIS